MVFRMAASSWEHLRVCGAVPQLFLDKDYMVGTSPRVRSGLPDEAGHARSLRNISACAERSPMMLARSPTWREHLRVCGAVDIAPEMTLTTVGTSPRVRSGRQA